MGLPLQQTDDKDLSLLSTKWKSILDPVLSNPLVNGRLISNVVLISGDNTINHGLQAKLQGYIVVRNSAASVFFDKPSPMPTLTLILNSSAPTTISLWVF